MTPNNEEFKAGQEAHAAGLSKFDNPYAAAFDRHDWDRGWNWAESEAWINRNKTHVDNDVQNDKGYTY